MVQYQAGDSTKSKFCRMQVTRIPNNLAAYSISFFAPCVPVTGVVEPNHAIAEAVVAPMSQATSAAMVQLDD